MPLMNQSELNDWRHSVNEFQFDFGNWLMNAEFVGLMNESGDRMEN